MSENNDDRVSEEIELATGAAEDAPVPTDSKESLFGDRESDKTPSDIRGALKDDSDEDEETSASEMLRRERERD